jgi:hypothetical protein
MNVDDGRIVRSWRSCLLLCVVSPEKIRRFMKLEPLISHVLSINDPRFAEFLPLIYIFQSWKLKRTQIQLRPHHFFTCTSNLTTVVNSVLKFMINEMTSILKS